MQNQFAEKPLVQPCLDCGDAISPEEALAREGRCDLCYLDRLDQIEYQT